MFMHQTLAEYIDNPMGKGSTAIANRNLIRTDLERRYDALIKKHKDFEYKLWYDGDDFYFHVKIPSETERNNTYDVVILLTPMGDKSIAAQPTFKNHYIKVFSNCPSFVFTYAYVYNDYEMIIDFLKGRFSDVVLSDNPVVKNPGEVINYEKSIFFACRYIMMHRTILTKLTWSGRSHKLNREKFYSEIRSSDKIMLEIKKENNRLAEEKKKPIKSIITDKGKSTKRRDEKKTTAVPKNTKQSKITPQKKIKPRAKIKPR